MEKELQGCKQGTKAKIHFDSIRTTVKKVPIWKTRSHNSTQELWFEEFTSIYDGLSIEMNRCLEWTNIPEWMTKRKTTLIEKDLQKGTAPNNYKTIMSPDDEENTNSIYSGGVLLLTNKLRTVYQKTERIQQENKRNRRSSIRWSTHHDRDQKETKKMQVLHGFTTKRHLIWPHKDL